MTQRVDRRGEAWGFAYDFAGKIAADTMPEITVGAGTNTRPVASFKSTEALALVDPASGEGTSSNPATTALNPTHVKPWVKNPRGQTTYFRLNPFRTAKLVEDPSGRVSTMSWNSDGLPTQTEVKFQDTVIADTRYEWDGPRLTKAKDELTGDSTRIGYKETTFYSMPDSIWRGTSLVRRIFSTGAHVDSVKAGTVPVSTTRFYADASGRDTLVVDPEGHKTRTYYRATGFQNTDSVRVVGADRRTDYRYDKFGRDSLVIAALTDTAEVHYDDLNRVIRTIGGIGEETAFLYDSLFLTQVTDAEGQQYQFAPNALGWLKTRTDPRGKSDTYEYDIHGNVTEWTDRRGKVVTFGYNDFDELIWRAADGDTTTFEQDPRGRFSVVANGMSRDSVAFDPEAGQTAYVTTRGGTTYRIVDHWNPQGLPDSVKITSPWGAKIEYGYNMAFQLEHLIDLSGDTTFVHYDADRLPWKLIYPGQTVDLEITYPSTHRAAALDWNLTGLQETLGRSYSHDLQSRISARFYAGSDTSRHYSYDQGGRLTGFADRIFSPSECTMDRDHMGEVCTPSSWTTADSVGYAYDQVGNPTGSGVTVETGNRLTAFEGYTLTWDDAGFLTSKLGNGVSQSFYWNALGQLDSLSTSDTTVSFAYDGLGRRIRKVVASSSGADTVQYLYRGADLFAELDGAGGRAADYTYWPGVDNPHAVRRGTTTYYFATEAGGNVSGLFTASGSLEAQYRYDAWGLFDHEAENAPNSLRFTAREWDPEANLYFYRARFYDPSIRRFISEDPIGLDGGINLFAYAGNHPINRSDPFGLTHCTGYGWLGNFEHSKTYNPKCAHFTLIGTWSSFGTRSSFFGISGHVTLGLLEPWPNEEPPETGALERIASIVSGVFTFRAPDEICVSAGECLPVVSGTIPDVGPGKGLKIAGKLAGYARTSRGRRHGLHQAISRDGGLGVSPKAILEALRNPQQMIPQSGGRMMHVGEDAVVVLNSTGDLITTWSKSRFGRRLRP